MTKTKTFPLLVVVAALLLTACTALADEILQPVRPTATATPTETPQAAETVPMDPTGPTVTPEPACVVVTGLDGDGWLNIRKAATEQSAILATVPDGTRLVVLTPGAWAKVRWGNLTGYVNATYCELEKPQ